MGCGLGIASSLKSCRSQCALEDPGLKNMCNPMITRFHNPCSITSDTNHFSGRFGEPGHSNDRSVVLFFSGSALVADQEARIVCGSSYI